jgi:hypothetical protein
MVRFSRNSLTSTHKPDEQLRQRPFAARSKPDVPKQFSAGIDSNGGAEFESPFCQCILCRL